MPEPLCNTCNDTRQRPAPAINAPWNVCPDCTRGALFARIEALHSEIKQLREALTNIAKGEGRFSREPLEHASNTIEDMKQLATDALEIVHA